MHYASLADLIARFGHTEIAQLSASGGFGSYDGSAPEINTARVMLALDDANTEVHGYVATRIRVPVVADGAPPAPHPLLTRLACDIARYRLYDDAAPDEVRARFSDAVSVLVRIACGAISLSGSSDHTPTHPQTAVMVADPPVFGRQRRRTGGMR